MDNLQNKYGEFFIYIQSCSTASVLFVPFTEFRNELIHLLSSVVSSAYIIHYTHAVDKTLPENCASK
jgi:hypothetical protein